MVDKDESLVDKLMSDECNIEEVYQGMRQRMLDGNFTTPDRKYDIKSENIFIDGINIKDFIVKTMQEYQPIDLQKLMRRCMENGKQTV